MNLRDDAEAAVRDIITTIEPGRAAAATTRRSPTSTPASWTTDDDRGRRRAAARAGCSRRSTPCSDAAELIRLLGALRPARRRGLVGVDTESDPGDPNRYVMFVGQGGLGLPDEEYYRRTSYAEIREAYLKHIAASLRPGRRRRPGRAGRSGSSRSRPTSPARHWDKVKTPRHAADVQPDVAGRVRRRQRPGCTGGAFLAGAEIDERRWPSWSSTQPSFFTEVAALLTDGPAAGLAEPGPKWRVIDSLAPYLSQAFVDEQLRASTAPCCPGTPELRERWKRGVGLVEGALGEAVGKVYVERHFSPVAKERMDELVANLIEAYRRSITELDWMTDETKAEALDKLAKFRPHIGYPTKWRDYSALEITRRRPDRQRACGSPAFELDRSIDQDRRSRSTARSG